MKLPKVSIIVPVFKVEKYLDRCVQSLLRQTMTDLEIILVDDGSPDNCPALCDDYAAEDSRIKVVHKNNAGLGMACNSGLEVATGEYVAFCDSDDWVDNNMYQVLYDTAIATKAQIVYSGLKRVDNNGNILGYLKHREKTEIFKDNEVSTLMFDMIASLPEEKNDRSIQVSAKVALYNRQFLESNNIKFVSERIYPSEDLVFNVLALLHATAVVVLPDFFYNYFENQSSITTTVKPLHFKNVIGTAELISSYFHNQEKYHSPENNENFRMRLARFLIAEARSQCGRIIHSHLSYKEKRHLLGNLHEDVSSIDIIKDYSISRLPKKYALMHYLIQRQAYAFLILILPKLY